MVSKGFPNVITSGRQYNIREKPSVILYTYINLHAGTPKPHPFNLRVLDSSPNVITSGRQYNIREKPSVILYTYINLHAGTPKPHPFNLRVLDSSIVIWSYMILEKLKLLFLTFSALVANPKKNYFTRWPKSACEV